MLLQKNSFLMDELNDLIHIHENALESDICDFLISLFEQVSDKHERYENSGKPNFTQFNLTEHRELTPEVSQEIGRAHV